MYEPQNQFCLLKRGLVTVCRYMQGTANFVYQYLKSFQKTFTDESLGKKISNKQGGALISCFDVLMCQQRCSNQTTMSLRGEGESKGLMWAYGCENKLL